MLCLSLNPVQERLRTLRSSLGSAARGPPETLQLQHMHAESAHQRHMRAESSPEQLSEVKPGDPTALEGLCSLLDLHLATLEQAQQTLHGLAATGVLGCPGIPITPPIINIQTH